MPSRDSCSTSATPTPPDCTTRPVTPGRHGRWRRTWPPGRCRAPRRRSSPGRPAACRAGGRPPAARRLRAASGPDVITTSDLTPRWPHCSATSSTPRGGHRDHRQVGGLGQVERRGQAPARRRSAGARGFTAYEAPAYPASRMLSRMVRPTVSAAPARADHRDRLGREEVPQAGHVRAASPARPRRPGRLARPGRPGRAAGTSARRPRRRSCRRTGRPASAKHLQHGLVLGQHVGGRERADPAAPGQRDQVLEQQGGDTPVVHVVGHRERDLGRAAGRPGGHVVAGHADHLAVRHGQQRRAARRRARGRPAGPPISAECRLTLKKRK